MPVLREREREGGGGSRGGRLLVLLGFVHMDAPKYLQTYSLDERALGMYMLTDYVIDI